MQPPEDYSVIEITPEGKTRVYVMVSGRFDAADWVIELTLDHPDRRFDFRPTTPADYEETGLRPSC